MKTQRIVYMGREVRDTRGRFTSFKRKVMRFFKQVLFWFSTGVVASLLLLAGGYFLGTTTTYQNVIAETSLPPVLLRIFECESRGQQFGKSGQVLLSPNTNGTVDVGIGQINTVWFAKATELGHDLTTEKGNIAMSVWIYENRGTGDWYSSQSCWKK